MPATFPSTIKPVVSQNYSFGTARNLLEINTLGGNPLIVRDYKYAPIEVNTTFVGDRLVKQVFTDFYYGTINSGQAKFYIDLDLGLGIETYIAQFVPGSISYNGNGDPLWTLSCTLRVENPDVEDAPFEGNLAAIYAEYGEESQTLLDLLDTFANDTLG